MTRTSHPVIVLRNISDDDVCSDCTHCTRGGNGHTCALGWPGTSNPDGYIVQCQEYRNTSDETTFGALPIGATFDLPEWGLLGQGETKVSATTCRSALGDVGTMEATREVLQITPLDHCRRALVRVDAAAGDRHALTVAHQNLIGYDPFADEPGADLGEVHDVLRDFVRELAASLGVHWGDVDPLAGAPAPAGWRLDC